MLFPGVRASRGRFDCGADFVRARSFPIDLPKMDGKSVGRSGMRNSIRAHNPEPASACRHGVAGFNRSAHAYAVTRGWRERVASNKQNSTPGSALDDCVASNSSRITQADRCNFRASETVTAVCLSVVDSAKAEARCFAALM